MPMYAEYAENYFNLGLKPTCISYLKTKYNITETNPEKSPCHSWRRWQVRNPNLSEIRNLPWDQASGVGTVLGHYNRCIDIDNCNSITLLKEFLKKLGLPADYEWAVKTPNGFHIHVESGNLIFLTDKELHEGVLALLPNELYKNRFKRIEVRWANHAVLPPSVINGMNYDFVFHNGASPKAKPKYLQLETLFNFLSKYCGSQYPNPEQLGGNVIINDVFYNVSFPSGYPGASIAAYKLYNIQDAIAFSKDKSVRYLNKVRIDAYDLVGAWCSYGDGSFFEFDYYIDYLDSPLFIDIETTGLIKDQIDYDSYPRIIQIAYYSWMNKDSKIINTYIKPDGFIVPKEIENLTGITTSFLIENGVPIHEALNKFIFKKEKSPIICYNCDFDIAILDSEFMRLKKKNSHYLGNLLRDGSQIFCLMKKINSVFGGKYLKLSEAYEMLFKDTIPVKGHDAVNDLEVLIDCYRLMDLYGYISLGNKGRTLI